MNVKLKILTAGVFFFMGADAVMAQKTKKDSVGTKNIEEVVVVGYRATTKKNAVASVASIKSETIENRPNANVLNSVQGQLAGVNITASTGQPGAKPEVLIRGLGTISGNTDPLYVIDGFPSNSDAFRTLNSNDIDRFEVLKDAIAISQYGNRGSNGVIVITTKKGKFGNSTTNIRYSSQYGVATLQRPKYEYANAKQLLKIEQIFGSGTGAAMTDAEIDAYNVDTDWVDYFFRPATTMSHDLSIEKSGQKVNNYTSFGYLEQSGILRTTGLKRFAVRNNFSGRSENDKLKYYINTAVTHSKNNEATNLGSGSINRNYVTGAFLGAPYLRPSDYAGSEWAYNYYNNSPGLLATPYMLMDKLVNYDNLTDETRVDVASEVSYDVLKDLTAKIRLGGQFLSNRFFQVEYPNSFNALLFSNTQGVSSWNGGAFNGFEDQNNSRQFIFNNLAQLEYHKKINEHTVNISASMEYNHARLQASNMRQRGLNPKTFVPNTGAGYVTDVSANDWYVPQISSTNLRNDLISYFSILDYDYAGKYGVMGSIRRDGTSRFIGDRQWGTFWAVGARWNISEENFLKEVSQINLIKLRGSYGITGNQRIVDGSVYAGILPPAFTDTYAAANNAYNGGLGYNLALGYPDLQWEPTKQYNAGVDFELFNYRLRGSFEYYNRKTEKLFIDAPISAPSGNYILKRNSEANITNKGFELNLAYDIIKDKDRDILLTLRGNGSYNKNTVDGIKANDGKIFFTDAGGYTYVTQNGGSILEPFVYNYVGVNPANGNLQFKDINGNITENPLASDRSAQGKNRLPKYQGGFGFDFNVKGLFVSSTFTYSFGAWRFDIDEENLYDVGNIGQFVVGTQMLDAWSSTNTGSNVPSLNATNLSAAGNSDRFLRDASYIRLRNLQLGYKVPKSLLNNTFVKSLSITLQAENLVTFTKWKGFDAESNRTSDFYQYPTPRIYTLGFDVKF